MHDPNPRADDEPTFATPEPGCYVDGHWGQYATARMVQIAADFGFRDEQASDLASRHLAAMGPSTAPGLSEDEFERLVDAADDAENWLNDNAPVEGFAWGWNDGEFGLYELEDDDA